jgi:N-glycosylase/DNA lyase
MHIYVLCKMVALGMEDVRMRDPDTMVIPGVVWGRPEWVPSAAFWASMVALADQDDDGFVERDVPLAEAVGFCLLGGYGVTAEVNHAAHDHLHSNGIYDLATSGSADELAGRIERLLREPLNVEGRRARYRFPRQRAGRLASAFCDLRLSPPSTDDVGTFRDHLMRINGIGPKTASWIARNWLGSTSVAILDIHVIRAGQIMGLFRRDARVPRDYFMMERRFLDFASAIGACPALLDAVMWRTMRNIQLGNGLQ